MGWGAWSGWGIQSRTTYSAADSSTTTSRCPAVSSTISCFLAERFALDLAQPAHRLHSHAAWSITRRRPFSLVRETQFVEIGRVTAFSHRTFSTLLPFPALRMGWGLDAHWAALAREHHWRCGVLDAVSFRHRAVPAAAAYSREAALAEAHAFLAERPYLSAEEIQRTLTTHRHFR